MVTVIVVTLGVVFVCRRPTVTVVVVPIVIIVVSPVIFCPEVLAASPIPSITAITMGVTVISIATQPISIAAPVPSTVISVTREGGEEEVREGEGRGEGRREKGGGERESREQGESGRGKRFGFGKKCQSRVKLKTTESHTIHTEVLSKSYIVAK